ncbi:hypothetical protein CRU79_14930 [Escherichia sp. E4385]|uniref:MASE4 domain-containing protein n=1 Tax=Escherichia sp. E4385 TaxID=2040639 RepID=UPI00107F513C|nr:hypothetical protein CRU79_14930 [Escherichia sp. E4385]
MIIICEYVLEYSYTGHYFSVSMIKWLLFAIPEITLDVILCFILCFAYKLEEGITVILILSVAFGIDALFLSSNIISVLSSIQIKENEAIIKNACNISFIYFLRHFFVYCFDLYCRFELHAKNKQEKQPFIVCDGGRFYFDYMYSGIS